MLEEQHLYLDAVGRFFEPIPNPTKVSEKWIESLRID
jgi:hypothetical protein